MFFGRESTRKFKWILERWLRRCVCVFGIQSVFRFALFDGLTWLQPAALTWGLSPPMVPFPAPSLLTCTIPPSLSYHHSPSQEFPDTHNTCTSPNQTVAPQTDYVCMCTPSPLQHPLDILVSPPPHPTLLPRLRVSEHEPSVVAPATRFWSCFSGIPTASDEWVGESETCPGWETEHCEMASYLQDALGRDHV